MLFMQVCLMLLTGWITKVWRYSISMVKKKPDAKKSKTKRKNIKTHHRIALVSLALTAIILAVGFSLWRSPATFYYKDLQSVESADGKFQIDVPKQMSLSQSGINILDYQHLKDDQSKGLLSHMRIESQFIGKQYINNTKNIIIGQLKDRNGPYFDSFRQKAQSGPSAKSLYFGNFSDYVNPNFSNALVADFSYSYQPVDVSGKILVAFAKDSIYIVTIEAVKSVWQDNPNIWTEIISSFKLN